MIFHLNFIEQNNIDCISVDNEQELYKQPAATVVALLLIVSLNWIITKNDPYNLFCFHFLF
jgi:hypothetical protein